MKSDLAAALRLIRTQPWFATTIIVTLAFGIGINTTIFTLANAVLLKPVPLPNGERLIVLAGQHPKQGDRRLNLSLPDFQEVQTQSESLERLEGVHRYQAVISEHGVSPERFNAAHVTPGLFDMLEVPPALGRTFQERDFLPGSESALLITHSVWKTRYGSDPDITSRAVRVNGRSAQIIGVMPEGFRFPENEYVWTPLIEDEKFLDRSNRWIQPFGLLKKEATLEDARAEIETIARNLAQAFPDTDKDADIDVLTFHERYNDGPIRILFLAMMGATGFVLLIACSNVANMLLSRAITRRQEISIRAALGATRARIVRQLLVESVVLSFLGGSLGLAITAFGVHAFDQATQDVGKPYWILFDIDLTVFAYFAGISLASGLLFGMAPALRASRLDLNAALKKSARGSDTRRAGRLAGALVVLQFSMTLVLLAGAGLMIRSFFAAQGLNDFLPEERILTAAISLPESEGERYAEPNERRLFFRALEERLSQLPGVSKVAMSNYLPGLGASSRPIEIDGQPNEEPESAPQAAFLIQTSDYFSVAGLPLRDGRAFLDTDDENGQRVAIASETFVETHWPGESGLGKRFRFLQDGEAEWLTIVGIASDIIQQPRSPDAKPLVYLPHAQRPWGYMAALLRIEGDPLALANSLREVVQELDQDLPVFDIRTLQMAKRHQYWFLVVFGSLFLCFAAAGLAMAAMGIYATVSHATTRRLQEIGIRMALGANAKRVLRLVLRRGLTQMGLGLAIGLALAFSTTHLLSGNVLFAISPRDPIAFAASCSILVAIGFLASWMPACKAAKLEPAKALRER